MLNKRGNKMRILPTHEEMGRTFFGLAFTGFLAAGIVHYFGDAATKEKDTNRLMAGSIIGCYCYQMSKRYQAEERVDELEEKLRDKAYELSTLKNPSCCALDNVRGVE